MPGERLRPANLWCVAQLRLNSEWHRVPGQSSGSLINELQNLCHQHLLSALKVSASTCLRAKGADCVCCRDHSVSDSLDYVAAYNAAMLPSRDIQEVFSAVVKGRRQPRFSKL